MSGKNKRKKRDGAEPETRVNAKAKPSGGYEVGYKRPPVGSRFQPGQSGNSKGRPKKARNLATEIGEELAERITVKVGERRKRVSKLRGIVKRTVVKALEGDIRAVNTVFDQALRVLGEDTGRHVTEGSLPADDAAILEDYFRLQSAQGSDAPEDPGTDGEDGPTDAAGAWADAYVLARAADRHLDPQPYLEMNDAYTFFEHVGGLLKTGPTHTNVMDLRVALVGD